MTDLEDILGVKIVVHEIPPEEAVLAAYQDDLFVETKRGTVIDEKVFASYFRDVKDLRYHNGLFFTRDGKCTEESLLRDIWDTVTDKEVEREANVHLITDLGRYCEKLMKAVKLASTVDTLDMNENIIPFRNGDFYVNEWEFHENQFAPTPYRLPCYLGYDFGKSPHFDKWMSDLFDKEDQETIQQYLGYCLVYNTKAQKALFLLGEGGAGKSGLGVILQALLGDAELNVANTQEFISDKFKLPELEHKLVLYDDDLDSNQLSDTGLYKKLITNTLKVNADRKYGQPFEFTPSIKLVACCNQMLTSAKDTTEGFYRRLLPVVIKPIAKDFVPDLSFYDKLRAERDEIVPFALLGLKRLINNGWRLPESDRTKAYLAQKREMENPLPSFMESVFDFGYGLSGVTMADILRVFEVWARQNKLPSLRERAIQTWFVDNAEKYGIVHSTNIPDGTKRVRGYKNMALKDEWKSSGKINLL